MYILKCVTTVMITENGVGSVNYYPYSYIEGASGGAVGSGTALQAGTSRVRFPMVSLEFFLDIIVSVAL
jgi:hypothetical protein